MEIIQLASQNRCIQNNTNTQQTIMLTYPQPCSSPETCPLVPGMATWNSMCDLNILVILLFTRKVASGFPTITRTCSLIFSFAQSKIKGWVWYWALYRITRTLKSSARTGATIIRLCLRSQVNRSLVSICL